MLATIQRTSRRAALICAALALVPAFAHPAMAHRAATRSAPPRAIELIPDEVLASIEIRDPDRHIDSVRELIDSWQLAGTPLDEAIAANDQLTRARAGLTMMSAAIGLGPWDAIEALAGRDIALGLAPGPDDQPRVIVAIRPRDREPIERLIEAVRMFAGKAEPILYHDQTILPVGDGLWLSLLHDGLLVANDEALIRGAIDLAHGRGRSVSRQGFYRRAQRQWPASADLRWVVDAKALRQLAGPMGLPVKLDEPGAAYLLGGWYAHLRQAGQITGWGTDQHGAWTLELAIDSGEQLPVEYAGFAPHQFNKPSWDATTIRGYAGELRLARDWADLIAEREALLTLAGVTQVANATTTLATITGGLDPVEDIYAHLQGPTRLILARQDFQPGQTVPSPVFPAFAVTMPLGAADNPDLERRLRSAAHIALALVAANQGEQRQAVMLLDMEQHAGQRVLYGFYPAPDEVAARSGQEYNFQPSVAIVRGELVIASTLDLMHSILDAIEAGQAPADDLPAAGDVLWLRAEPIARMLEDNLDELVAQRVLEQDATKADATRDLRALIQLVDLFDGAELRSTLTDRGAHGSLTVRPIRPGGGR